MNDALWIIAAIFSFVMLVSLEFATDERPAKDAAAYCCSVLGATPSHTGRVE